MKIILQNTDFYPIMGGIETYLYYVSKELIKLGHEPSILCSRGRQNLSTQDAHDNIKILRHPYRNRFHRVPLYDSRYLVWLQKFIQQNCKDADVIWSRHPYYCFASCKAKLDLSITYIQATAFPLFHKYALSRTNLFGKFYNVIRNYEDYHIEKYAMQKCNQIVVLSNIRKKEISDFYNFPETRIKVIPPGVDLERFIPREKDADLLRELEISKDIQIILGVGRIRAEKNFSMLVEAFAKLTRKKDVYLVIVGDGSQILELKEKAKKLNVEKRIRFIGYRRDVERFYSIADVFVLPSKYEGFGHVYLEAMASGVPCIGLRSDYPKVIVATEEIIKKGITGFYADPYLVDDLVEKIQTIICDDALKWKMSIEARRLCEEEYSWSKSVDELLKVK